MGTPSSRVTMDFDRTRRIWESKSVVAPRTHRTSFADRFEPENEKSQRKFGYSPSALGRINPPGGTRRMNARVFSGRSFMRRATSEVPTNSEDQNQNQERQHNPVRVPTMHRGLDRILRLRRENNRVHSEFRASAFEDLNKSDSDGEDISSLCSAETKFRDRGERSTLAFQPSSGSTSRPSKGDSLDMLLVRDLNLDSATVGILTGPEQQDFGTPTQLDRENIVEDLRSSSPDKHHERQKSQIRIIWKREESGGIHSLNHGSSSYESTEPGMSFESDIHTQNPHHDPEQFKIPSAPGGHSTAANADKPSQDSISTFRRLNSSSRAGDVKDGLEPNPESLFFDSSPENIIEHLFARQASDLSVFECCIILQVGIDVLKKSKNATFSRYEPRRFWLSPDCNKLFWKSRKVPGNDFVFIQNICEVRHRQNDRSMTILLSGPRRNKYGFTMLFANSSYADVWTRALSCLVPLQAKVSQGFVTEGYREDYSISDDSFNNQSLYDHIAVNSYIPLCNAYGQEARNGNRLTFSISESAFCGLRYVRQKDAKLILRSRAQIAILKRLNHPSILKYHDCFVDPKYFGYYLTFENAPRGALGDSWKRDGAYIFPEERVGDIVLDIIEGVQYLHRMNISHGDIRPETVLMFADGSVKLNPIGFVSYNNLGDETYTSQHIEARLSGAASAFLPPELCWQVDRPKGGNDLYKADVWSIGALMYFMLYGRVPFDGMFDKNVQEHICAAPLRFPQIPKSSQSVRGLLNKILDSRGPETRISLQQMMRHPWIVWCKQRRLSGLQEKRLKGTKGAKPYEHRYSQAFEDEGRAHSLAFSAHEVDAAVMDAKVRVLARKKRFANIGLGM